MNSRNNLIGITCGILAGVCWGLSGVCGQYLFSMHGINSTWLVPIRLFSSGVILIVIVFNTKRQELEQLTRNRRDLIQAILSGVFGTMMLQISFFATVQSSNAGTATVMQYLCPVITMIYICCRDRKKPERNELIAIIMAVGGVFLISTHGNIHSLEMTPTSLVLGLATAFSMFLATVLPEGLYKRYSTEVVLSIGMLVGGIILMLVFKPWRINVQWDISLFLCLLVIIGAGSILSYFLYGCAIKMIGPTKTSLLASVEVLAAAVPAIIWLRTAYSLIEVIGFGLIVGTLFVINRVKGLKYEEK